jgi:hypothetical protein
MLDVRAERRVSTTVPLVLWSVLVAVAFVWGSFVERAHKLYLATPPFWSERMFHVSWHVLPAVAVGGAIIAFGPPLARVVAWRPLLGISAVASLAWASAVSVIDNVHGTVALVTPLQYENNDYMLTAHTFTSLHAGLSTFIAKLPHTNQYTKGHPPGFTVIEYVLLRFGVGWADAFTVGLTLAGGIAAGLAALVALREVANEDAARVAAPFVVLAPAVIWWQSADAFFAGVGAWAVTLLILASGRAGRRADIYAAAGGLLFGYALFLSFGLALLAVIPVAVCIARRRFRPLVVGAIAMLPVFAWFAAMGYSWWAGYGAMHHLNWRGVAKDRPYRYFVLGDLAAFAIATGPAIAVGLSRLRWGKTALLVGASTAVVLLADVSGMSKGEVERIWLPFVPWVALAGAALGTRAKLERLRPYLGLQLATTMVIAVVMWSQW